MQLAKYLTNFGNVLYNTHEEQISMSLQNAMYDYDMEEVEDSFLVVPGESVDDLINRLSRRKSPNIIFIDSVQHAEWTKRQYKLLKTRFPNKLFIYISHARGKNPKGEVAQFIRYDADLKIRVEGFRAFVQGRLNKDEGQFFDIYPKKSAIYWNQI